MTTVATRLITLILILERQPGQKAADLAARLGVSVRTLHRYFGMLDEMGVPVYAERGPYGGFSLVRGYKLPPLILTPEEAVAVSLGASLVREMWGQLYQEAAQGALAKLESVLPDEQRREVGWARRSLAATGLNRSDIEMLAPQLEMLRKAVRENQTLRMTYASNKRPQGETRPFDPYALVHRWGWWYAVGYCHLRKDLRTFRVDRMEEITPTGSSFKAPVDFDLQAYMAKEWVDAPQVHVRMRFLPAWAHLARTARSYWEAFEVQADGAVEVTFNAPDVPWAASTALAYGPAVTILEPEEARRMVLEWAQATVMYYRENDNKENL